VQLEACHQQDQAALVAVLAAVLAAAQQEKLMTVASLAAPQLAKATAAVQEECLPQLARRLLRQAQQQEPLVLLRSIVPLPLPTQHRAMYTVHVKHSVCNQKSVDNKLYLFVIYTKMNLAVSGLRNFEVQVVPLDLAERQEALEPQVPALMPLVEILVALRAVLVQLEACHQRDQAALAAALAAVLVAAQQETLMTVASLAAPQLAKATAVVQECLPQLAR
jgi:hypothetical protein